jgi:GNAT superfamily N-acetyltransferase
MQVELPKTKIRLYTEDDLSALVELVQSTIQDCYPEVYPKEVVDFFLEYHSIDEVNKRIKNKKTSLFLAFQDEMLVGSGYLTKKEVGGVYIRKSKQGTGIGKQIVERIIEKAKENGYDHIWLDATLLAKEFYLSMGFQLIENMTDYVSDNIPLHYYRMFMKL